MLDGTGLGWVGHVIKAQPAARSAYERMLADPAFLAPIRWSQIRASDLDTLVLPGGHAREMKPYLESEVLQSIVRTCLDADKTVAAICHGVLIAAWAKGDDGRSVLADRRCTTLPGMVENIGWRLTRKRMGDDYFKLYEETAEQVVRSSLGDEGVFLSGPRLLRPDTADKPGFVVVDGNLITARYPGDAHGFARAVVNDLNERRRSVASTPIVSAADVKRGLSARAH